MAYAAAGFARRLDGLDDAAVRDAFLADLHDVLPGTRGIVDEVVIRRWGRGLPYPRVGRSKLQPALTRSLAPVWLAGDYLGTVVHGDGRADRARCGRRRAGGARLDPCVRVIVIGGGVVGLSCAFALRQDGHEVEVLEARGIGLGASAGNAGWVTPSLSSRLADRAFSAWDSARRSIRRVRSSSGPSSTRCGSAGCGGPRGAAGRPRSRRAWRVCSGSPCGRWTRSTPCARRAWSSRSTGPGFSPSREPRTGSSGSRVFRELRALGFEGRMDSLDADAARPGAGSRSRRRPGDSHDGRPPRRPAQPDGGARRPSGRCRGDGYNGVHRAGDRPQRRRVARPRPGRLVRGRRRCRGRGGRRLDRSACTPRPAGAARRRQGLLRSPSRTPTPRRGCRSTSASRSSA